MHYAMVVVYSWLPHVVVRCLLPRCILPGRSQLFGGVGAVTRFDPVHYPFLTFLFPPDLYGVGTVSR